MVGELSRTAPSGAVADGDAEGADAREDVELGDREGVHAVEPDGVAQGHQVHPAAAAAAAGGGAELAAALAGSGRRLVLELGGEGAGADAGRVGLGDPPDLVDVARSDAGADAWPRRRSGSRR